MMCIATCIIDLKIYFLKYKIKNMDLQILVPTMNKTKEQIFDLCRNLNVQSDCVIANQCGYNDNYYFKYNNHTINVVCTDTVGVSKNRNVLLENLTSEVGLMLDDDCVMSQDYFRQIADFFIAHPNAVFVLFNGILNNDGIAKKIHNRKTARANKYYKISYAGAPGLCFRKNAILKSGIKYDETIGTPNYIVAGEDTVFHYNLLKSNKNFYISESVIFTIFNNNETSTYFNGIDERYIVTRGYITKYIHPYTCFLYKIKHCLRFKNQSRSLSLFEIFKYFNKGVKMFKIRSKHDVSNK